MQDLKKGLDLLVADKEIKRSQQAKDILENPIFVEAINKIRSDLANEWLNSDVKNSEQRENIFIMRRMLELVVMQIQSVMETGKIIKK
jgi:hypothetical protein